MREAISQALAELRMQRVAGQVLELVRIGHVVEQEFAAVSAHHRIGVARRAHASPLEAIPDTS